MNGYHVRSIESDRGEKPVPVDSESQLFVDDAIIAHREALMRRLNRPRKEPGPFLSPEAPWEGQSLLYGSIVEHDAYWVVPTFNPPIRKDGKLLIHFNGRDVPHTVPGFRHTRPGMSGTFALSTLREDGFVSLDATGNPGVLVTRLLQVKGEREKLEVNACPFIGRPGVEPMRLKVRILSQDDEELGAWDIQAPPGDERVWHPFALRKTLPEVIRLEFRMTNTRIYSFRLV